MQWDRRQFMQRGLAGLVALTAAEPGIVRPAEASERSFTSSEAVRVSELEGADFAERWAAALVAVAQRPGARAIIFDQDAVISRALEPLSREHSGIIVHGLPGKSRVSAAIPLQSLFRVNADCRLATFASLILDGRGLVTNALIDSLGRMATFSDLNLTGSKLDDYCAGLAIAGSRSSVGHCQFSDLAMGLRIRSASKTLSNVQVDDCTFHRIGRRGLSIASGGPPVIDITVRNVRIEAPAKPCQPVRVDAAKGAVRKVNLMGGHIIGQQTESNADDALSINSGVTDFVVSGWKIERHSDVGINVSGGCRRGIITRNNISGPDYGINVGALRDRAIARNRDVEITDNSIDACRVAIFRVFESDRVAIHGNRFSMPNDRQVPLLEYRNSRNLSLHGCIGSEKMPNRDVDQGEERSTFQRVEGLFTEPPNMSGNAVANESRIRVLPDGKEMTWDGSVFRNRGKRGI